MISITSMLPAHWEQVRAIYEEGIATGNATFQLSAPTWEEWDQAHIKSCRLVALQDEKVCGWAALTGVSSRCVYAGVAEVSVYVAQKSRGQNLGYKLLNELVILSEKNDIWTLQSGIFPENKQSVAIHEKNGFRIVGYREKIGKMHGMWRDNLFLERRSSIVGVN